MVLMKLLESLQRETNASWAVVGRLIWRYCGGKDEGAAGYGGGGRSDPDLEKTECATAL